MKPTIEYPVRKRRVDDQMNEEFHALLRQAADERELRQRTLATEETAAAARESRAFLTLARTRASQARSTSEN